MPNDGQMRPFALDKKEALVKMLEDKKRILITITKDEGTVVSDQAISTSNYKINGDVLIANDKTSIPINEESIEYVADNHAEIGFIDQDGCATNIRIMAR